VLCLNGWEFVPMKLYIYTTPKTNVSAGHKIVTIS
jgi:hypothetical protein